MLELPEVEVLRKELEREVVGKRVKEANVKNASIVRDFHRTRPDFAKALEGRQVEGVRRRGTVLFLDLDEQQSWIIDPGESASVHRESASTPMASDTDVIITFTTGGSIHVTDATRGDSCRMGVVATEDALALAGVTATAVDPFEDSVTWIDFGERLHEAGVPLKTFLMDQSRFLGIGTVYSDEALFEAGLSHDRRSDTMSTQEVRRLYRAIQEVLQAAIKQRGLAVEDTGADDSLEDEAEVVGHLKVFGREGMPCLRCRSTVVKTKIKGKAKEFTFHCERCQQ